MISGTLYRRVTDNLARQTGKNLTRIRKVYRPNLFRFNRALNQGVCDRPGGKLENLPKSFSFDEFGNLLGDLTETRQATLAQWPEHWKARIVAVQACNNIDSLQQLLKTETTARVIEAIRAQLELNGVTE
jgi:hypothetical protein